MFHCSQVSMVQSKTDNWYKVLKDKIYFVIVCDYYTSVTQMTGSSTVKDIGLYKQNKVSKYA